MVPQADSRQKPHFPDTINPTLRTTLYSLMHEDLFDLQDRRAQDHNKRDDCGSLYISEEI